MKHFTASTAAEAKLILALEFWVDEKIVNHIDEALADGTYEIDSLSMFRGEIRVVDLEDKLIVVANIAGPDAHDAAVEVSDSLTHLAFQ